MRQLFQRRLCLVLFLPLLPTATAESSSTSKFNSGIPTITPSHLTSTHTSRPAAVTASSVVSFSFLGASDVSGGVSTTPRSNSTNASTLAIPNAPEGDSSTRNTIILTLVLFLPALLILATACMLYVRRCRLVRQPQVQNLTDVRLPPCKNGNNHLTLVDVKTSRSDIHEIDGFEKTLERGKQGRLTDYLHKSSKDRAACDMD